jgi:hypothetical protein
MGNAMSGVARRVAPNDNPVTGLLRVLASYGDFSRFSIIIYIFETELKADSTRPPRLGWPAPDDD